MKRLLAGMACWLLTGCMQSSIVMQLYDAGDANKATVIEEIENFASESAMQVQWPEVTPAASHAEVTVVHGSDWQTASLAWDLADRLRGLGVSVVVKSSRLQNHVVTGRHIGVFVGKSEGTTESDGFGDQISQLVCYTPDGDEAIILMYGDGALEIQTYFWDEETEAIVGENHNGKWRAAGKTLNLEAGGKDLKYEATDCLPVPGRSTPCREDLRWVSGRSIPVLEGCDISARNIQIFDYRSSRCLQRARSTHGQR